jgi:ubiquinone/menaquinone biosynthesis C-methylase UbiE
MNNDQYPGKELFLFTKAVKWKTYWSSRVLPYLGKNVLEVGAGLGSNTLILCKNSTQRWVCLEPDKNLSRTILKNIKSHECYSRCEVRNGKLQDLSPDEKFDSVLYIDVLEHIQNDREELLIAFQHLTANGKVIVLAPSHPFLFSEFDQAIGHYRRYNRLMIRKLSPPGSKLLHLEYLDSLGMLLSYANRMVLKQKIPHENDIRIWDSVVIPYSRILDKILRYRLGKSLLVVWCKP